MFTKLLEAEEAAHERQTLQPLLMLAIAHGQTPIAEKLIGAGVSPGADEKGNTALHHAVHHGQDEIVELLLRLRASVNVLNGQGRLVLHMAIDLEKIEILELLLPAVDINVKSGYGQTPLQDAVWSEQEKMVQLFIEYHADLNIQDNFGRTALHAAVHINSVPILEQLLKAGENPWLFDLHGRDCLDWQRFTVYNFLRFLAEAIYRGPKTSTAHKAYQR